MTHRVTRRVGSVTKCVRLSVRGEKLRFSSHRPACGHFCSASQSELFDRSVHLRLPRRKRL
ncbi:hypothetical protein [Lysobacter gummosus]|uniref:hypothetical protein n=1 Tax=Lysobacter gummosus TaxID=262324 RepID=UPI00362E6D48